MEEEKKGAGEGNGGGIGDFARKIVTGGEEGFGPPTVLELPPDGGGLPPSPEGQGPAVGEKGGQKDAVEPFARGRIGSFLSIPSAGDIFRDYMEGKKEGPDYNRGLLGGIDLYPPSEGGDEKQNGARERPIIRFGPELPQDFQKKYIPGGSNEFSLPKAFGGGEYGINARPSEREDPITHEKKRGIEIIVEGEFPFR